MDLEVKFTPRRYATMQRRGKVVLDCLWGGAMTFLAILLAADGNAWASVAGGALAVIAWFIPVMKWMIGNYDK